MNKTVLAILLVDDSQLIRKIEKIRLETQLSLPCEIFTAESGEKGLEMIKQRLGEKKHFSVIITDFSMPGMNGVEFAEKACNIMPDALRILYSSHNRIVASDVVDCVLQKRSDTPFALAYCIEEVFK